MTRELQDKARAHMDKNEWAEAIEFLEQAIVEEPQNPYVVDNLAFCHSRLGHHDQAIPLYKQLCEQQPDNARWRYMLGYQYYGQQDYATAVTYFDEALAINPNYLVAHYRKGYALSTMGFGRRGHALTAFEQCRSAYHALPDGEEKQRETKHYADACYQQGKVFLEAGNYEKAIERLEEAVSLKPNDIYAHYSLGKSLVADRRYAEAIQPLEKARRLAGKPEHYILDRLAQAYSGEDRLQEAMQIYEKMPNSMRQQWAYILRNMGEVYIRLEQWDKAEEVLEDATRKDRRNHNGFYFLGQVHQEKEQWSDAVVAYQKAVQLRQRHQKKPFPEAEDAMKAILETHPDAGKNRVDQRAPKASAGRQVARVKNFLSKGFGFLETDDGDLFFHINEVRDRKEVRSGEYLEYEVGTSRDGRPAAVNLRVVDSD